MINIHEIVPFMLLKLLEDKPAAKDPVITHFDGTKLPKFSKKNILLIFPATFPFIGNNHQNMSFQAGVFHRHAQALRIESYAAHWKQPEKYF